MFYINYKHNNRKKPLKNPPTTRWEILRRTAREVRKRSAERGTHDDCARMFDDLSAAETPLDV